MQAEIKIENGNVLARRAGSEPWIRSPDKIRTAHGKPIKIAHWINPHSMETAWVLDSLRMEMLYSRDNCNEHNFFGNKYGYYTSAIVSYDRCVLVTCNLCNISEIRLLSADTGLLLAGSNIFSSSYSYPWALCLGSNYDPTSLSPIEALIHNQANSDLEWIGDSLKGEWKDGIFHVTTWPENDKYEWIIPCQIRENIDAWSRC